MTTWEYRDEEQKWQMEEPVTPQNVGLKLRLIREISGISRRELARILGVSESTLARLESAKTVATKPFMEKLGALQFIGHHKYSRLSAAEKEQLSEAIGTAGGTLAGVGGAIGAVSASGYAGLSAAGITSGLATIGGGTMMGGLSIVAIIPLVAGVAGYGLVRGVKAICEANNLSCKEVDGQYEIVPNPES